ncbi:alpha/beta-hydrolase [Mycena crocata]|nr:alpha/beta-hydrolase [Mycena crocata]
MDVVAQMKETAIQTILFPTIAAFAPLLEAKRDEITGARKTFKYGATERHQLDVYYPPNTGKKNPLLIFVYGGGFVSGERTLPAPVDLGYGNLGLYFAKRGFLGATCLTVGGVPDYRLAPSTTFPGPAEDIRDVLAWAISHPENLGPDVDVESAFLLGHSAGGVHTLTLLLEPSILASATGVKIKGVAVASAPYHFAPVGVEMDAREPANMYYGTPETTEMHDPLGLLGVASTELIRGLPPLALVTCEYDPEWFKIVAKDFSDALAEKGLAPPQMLAKGHNHISFSWALETGKGEEWAEELVAWMESL